MNEIKPNGTEVLIFKYVRENSYQDENNFITGIIISSKQSDDLSYHGSSWYEQIYEVLGEDGKKYYGCYGDGLIGSSFFRTREDHIKRIKNKIKRNEETILNLQDENVKYQQQINSISKNEPKPIKKTYKVKIKTII